MKQLLLFLAILSICVVLFSCHPTISDNNINPHITEVADTNVVLPPAWAFGIIWGAYTNQVQSIELIDQIIAHNYPIDAFWIDSWIWDWKNQGQGPKKYMDFVADTISYPNMKGMWDYMEFHNIKGGMWMWDAIMRTGNEEEYEDFKSQEFFKSENIRTDGWHNGLRTTIIGDNSEEVKGTWCGDIDFENPEATAYFQQRVKHFFDAGVDFIKLDKTDAIPVCKAMFETTQKLGKETNGRGFILSHSHGVDTEEYKRYPGKWTDDTRSDWTVENPSHEFSPWLPNVAFKENLAMYTDTTRHFYKIPFLANDMGGFAVGTDGLIDDELFIRWLEFAHFVPLTTPFSQPENPTGNIPFKVSERADSIFRFYSHLKMELFPYIYSYAHLARIDGINIIRPTRLYEYLFGEEILVAPVYEQGKNERDLLLPAGSKWINYWTGEVFDGGQSIIVKAPIGQIPLFIKQGAILPKRKYARSIESGTNDLLELHVYDGSNGHFLLIEDDGRSNDYLKGLFAQTKLNFECKEEFAELTINEINGEYKNMNKTRKIFIVFHSSRNLKEVALANKEIAFKMIRDSYRIELNEIEKSEKQVVTFKF